MNDDDRNSGEVPRRSRPLRFTRFRDVVRIVAVAVGVVVAISGSLRISAGGDPLTPVVGAGLVVLGVVDFFVNRGQAKRGR